MPAAYTIPDSNTTAAASGFVCDIKGVARNQIVRAAEHINCCMVHRGGVGYEKNTGDGAGILTALPHKLFAKFSKRQLKTKLPQPGRYGAGNVFLPRAIKERQHCKNIIEERIKAEGQVLLGWRKVPVDPDGAGLGKAARRAMPTIEQLFIGAAEGHRAGRVRAQALPDPQERHAPAARQHVARRAEAVLRLQPVDQSHRLQRHADAASAVPVLSRPRRSRLRVAPGDGALALLDEHVPVVGPRAAEAVHEPQRRNQHAARQQELDERARRRRRQPSCSATTSTSCSRSSSPTAPTPARSTTCSNSC